MPENESQSQSSEAFVIVPDRGKLEALAEFAAGAGHEINNPLATIIGRAQLLLKDEHDPQRRQMLMSIGAQAYRIRDMIGDVMVFGRPPRPELGNIDLIEVIRGVVDKHQSDFAGCGCSVEFTCPHQVILRADPAQLSIVLGELLRNSWQALQPTGGKIRMIANVESDRAIIEITDEGKGFTELERIHAFDPFFSGRQAGRGLGFGLPKCWQIVRQHDGNLEIHSSANGPTTVRVVWPVVDSNH